jgi:hypothetical protein
VCSQSAHARQDWCMHSRMSVFTDRRTHITSTGTHAWVHPLLKKYHQNILEVLKYVLITILYPKKGCEYTRTPEFTRACVCARIQAHTRCHMRMHDVFCRNCRCRTHAPPRLPPPPKVSLSFSLSLSLSLSHTHTLRGDGEGKIWCLSKRLPSATCSRRTLKR